ncbi:MAG: HAMP domain-containing sensor histidine kinase, partial [Pseudomonadota bacterium]
GLLVRPMLRISKNMLHFSDNPEDASRIIVPSDRTDEIGTTERELADMQGQLVNLIVQKNRLAQLGLAVSKINHDLRNMLASAQLLSDRLTAIPDPTVQRFTPKLIASLDRAINFCNDTLRFGRAEEATPRRAVFPLKPLVQEVADGLGLPRPGNPRPSQSGETAVDWTIDIPDNLSVDADPDHLLRVLSNLCRNALQILETSGPGLHVSKSENGGIDVRAWREGRRVTIEISDNGPGLPPKAREKLFRAFQGSQRKGGTGLGLAIAAELVAAHGGQLRLLDKPEAEGAAFEICLPDRLSM